MEIIENEKAHFLKEKIPLQCPFINSFLTGCHCTDMRSTRVEEAIYYCGANYRKCDIYKMLKTGGSDIPFQLSHSVHGENI